MEQLQVLEKWCRDKPTRSIALVFDRHAGEWLINIIEGQNGRDVAVFASYESTLEQAVQAAHDELTTVFGVKVEEVETT